MTRATIFDQLSSLADPTRGRLLLLLDRNELTVGELCAVLQLPQSTVSRHLKTLGDEGWVTSRAEGTSRQYRIASPLDAAAKRLWQLVRDQTAQSTLASARAQEVQARADWLLALAQLAHDTGALGPAPAPVSRGQS